MQSEVIAVLENVNREIRELVSKLSEDSTEAGKVILPPGKLEVLSKRLAHTTELIAVVSPAEPKEPKLHVEIGEYLSNLVKLKAALERVQASLGERQEGLRKNLERLSAARAWAAALRQTKSA